MSIISYPIICVAPQSREVCSTPPLSLRTRSDPLVWIVNRLLQESGIFDEDNISNFAFVDSIDDYYDGPTQMSVESASNPLPPSIGKSPLECSQMLQRLCKETESNLIENYFIIMDERSIRDDTVLLVSAGDDEDWPLHSVRASFKAWAERLVCYFTGHIGIKEDAEDAAENANGVLRGSNTLLSLL
jgi:hypothetical protein